MYTNREKRNQNVLIICEYVLLLMILAAVFLSCLLKCHVRCMYQNCFFDTWLIPCGVLATDYLSISVSSCCLYLLPAVLV